MKNGGTVCYLLKYTFDGTTSPCASYGAAVDPDGVTVSVAGKEIVTGGVSVTGSINAGLPVLDIGEANRSGERRQALSPPLEARMLNANPEDYSLWNGRFSILTVPAGASGQKFPPGPQDNIVAFSAVGKVETGFTPGDKIGPYLVSVTPEKRPENPHTCAPESYGVPTWTIFAAGVTLQAELDGREGEGVGTFIRNIEVMNKLAAGVELPPGDGRTIKKVLFSLAGDDRIIEAAPFATTYNMGALDRDETNLSLWVTLNDGTVFRDDFPFYSIGFPSWYNVVTKMQTYLAVGFDPQEKKYRISFNYPGDFIWNKPVPDWMPILGGQDNEAKTSFAVHADYFLDAKSALTGEGAAQTEILGKTFTLKEDGEGRPLYTGGSNVDNTNTDCVLAYSVYRDGAWRTTPGIVPAPGAFTRLTPHAAPLPDRRVALVFIQKEGSGYKLLFSLYDPQGDSWTSPVTVDAGGYLIEEPKVHIYLDGPRPVAKVLYRKHTGQKDGLYSTRRDLSVAVPDGGSGFSPPQVVSGDDRALMWLAAAVAPDGTVVFSATEKGGAATAAVTGGVTIGAAAPVPGATLTKVYTEQPVVTGGLIEAVALTAGVNVVRPGSYRLQATLVSAAGRTIVTVAGQSQALGSGEGLLTMTFPGRVIGAAGSDGPFRIQDILLIDTTLGSVIAHEDPLGLVTRAYAANQFPRSRLTADGMHYIGPEARMHVTVTDENRAGAASTEITVVSSAVKTPISVTLPAVSPGVFAGDLGFSTTVAGTNTIKVENAGIIRLTYTDGQGGDWYATAYWTERPVAQGDVNGDEAVDMADAVLALQVLSGRQPADVKTAANVDGDGKIGLAEVVYILQKVGRAR